MSVNILLMMKGGLVSLFYFSIIIFTFIPTMTFIPSVDGKCPNGYHKSPSGDCEKVTHSGGLPRCPDGYHRSPDGDCERVVVGDSGSMSSESEDNDELELGDIEGTENRANSIDDNDSVGGGEDDNIYSTQCKGIADCFEGIVTKVVDGDTLDVNNVRVRLALVNTPERGDVGYDEAKETTESECSVGSKALVDEDDGQKEGSFGRLIGKVSCNGNNISLNELLLQEGKAILYEDFCDVSEFAGESWVTNYGC